MREYAGMARKQLRTSNYSPEARTRLGEAVEAARMAAGYRYRTEFCRAHHIKNLRGLELLEQGKTGVGQAFLFEVADSLPGWTRETPQIILEGGAAPPPPSGPEPSGLELDNDWTKEDQDFYDDVVGALKRMGLTPTPENIREMRRRTEEEAGEQGTERGDADRTG